jgi:Caspase domain/Sel1 repeat
MVRLILSVFLAWTVLLPIAFAQQVPPPAGAQSQASSFTDNADAVAVIIGNRTYRQTVPVDFAHNDADAMREWLTGAMGFRAENIIVLKDATLSEFNQTFGTERNPQAGRLWRSVREGRSNVFVYISGHGVPDLASRQPFLLPHDGNPNQSESGYLLDTLYRNLELVKQKTGTDRQVIVMLDACFTGETGRKGETLLAVSAPGFQPARPKSGGGVIKLLATAAATPANWDGDTKLGLFTSRFLMGVGGLADAAGNGDGATSWDELRDYLKDEVPRAARRDSGRDQMPEIDAAPLVLKASAPVAAVTRGVQRLRDEIAWQTAEKAGTREGYERYVARCGDLCAFRQAALQKLSGEANAGAAAADEASWKRFSAAKQYREYLNSCGRVCAYRQVAQNYLGVATAAVAPPVAPPADDSAERCDALASDPRDADKPKTVKGQPLAKIDARAAIEACKRAAAANPAERRFAYQLGRAHDRADQYREAFAAYKQATDKGSAAAFNNFGTLYENGQGTPRSLETAFSLYLQAAKGGAPLGMFNAARMLEAGRGTTKDAEQSFRWYQAAAEAGDTMAITKLVPAYVEGRPGIPKNPQKGFDLFMKAAQKGDPVAQVTIAALIDNGFGGFFPGRTSQDMLMQALNKGETGALAVIGTENSPTKLKPDTVRALQRVVTKEQFYSGQIDGKFNPLFVTALNSFARMKESQ